MHVWGGYAYCFGILCIPLMHLGCAPRSLINVFIYSCLPIKKKKKTYEKEKKIFQEG